jgi:hypothetical protein
MWVLLALGLMIIGICKRATENLQAGTACRLKATETTREKATYENHDRRMGW